MESGVARGGIAVLWVSACFGEPGYVDPRACRPCHQQIFDSYSRTAMGRSFSQATPADEEASYFHTASRRHYRVYRKDGALFVSRTLAGGTDLVERRIDYVVGSGNHARSFLHRSENGKLIELPVSWYAENGGYWAMSPGFDRPDHSEFRRQVPDSCLFCHNGYPRNGVLAQGIDCQRCHGPGEDHVNGRGAILNPARLSPERHLKSACSATWRPPAVPFRTPFAATTGSRFPTAPASRWRNS